MLGMERTMAQEMKHWLSQRRPECWSWAWLSFESGHPVWRLRYWQRRLDPANATPRRGGPAFVAVEVKEPVHAVGSIAITTPTGYRLELADDIAPEQLRRVVEVRNQRRMAARDGPNGLLLMTVQLGELGDAREMRMQHALVYELLKCCALCERTREAYVGATHERGKARLPQHKVGAESGRQPLVGQRIRRQLAVVHERVQELPFARRPGDEPARDAREARFQMSRQLFRITRQRLLRRAQQRHEPTSDILRIERSELTTPPARVLSCRGGEAGECQSELRCIEYRWIVLEDSNGIILIPGDHTGHQGGELAGRQLRERVREHSLLLKARQHGLPLD